MYMSLARKSVFTLIAILLSYFHFAAIFKRLISFFFLFFFVSFFFFLSENDVFNIIAIIIGTWFVSDKFLINLL